MSEIMGIPIKIDPECPDNEIWFENKDGKIIGKIVNLGRTVEG